MAEVGGVESYRPDSCRLGSRGWRSPFDQQEVSLPTTVHYRGAVDIMPPKRSPARPRNPGALPTGLSGAALGALGDAGLGLGGPSPQQQTYNAPNR